MYEYEMNSLDNVYYYRGAAIEAFALASGSLDLNSIVLRYFRPLSYWAGGSWVEISVGGNVFAEI